MIRLIASPAFGVTVGLLLALLKLAEVGRFTEFPWWLIALVFFFRPALLMLVNSLLAAIRFYARSRWKPKVGDRAGFRNLLGEWTIVEIQRIDADGLARVGNRSMSASIPLAKLYPEDACHG